MARKKSVGGRARAKTIENTIQLQAERINRRFQSLERAGNYGKFRSADLIRFASRNPYVSIKRSRGSKRHRIIVQKVKMTLGEKRLITKEFEATLKSKGFSNRGIQQIKAKTKSTLSTALGKNISDSDLEKFYDIAKNDTQDIIEQIGSSEFFLLVMEAKSHSYGLNRWYQLLSNYVLITNDVMRKRAEELYNKYVA